MGLGDHLSDPGWPPPCPLCQGGWHFAKLWRLGGGTSTACWRRASSRGQLRTVATSARNPRRPQAESCRWGEAGRGAARGFLLGEPRGQATLAQREADGVGTLDPQAAAGGRPGVGNSKAGRDGLAEATGCVRSSDVVRQPKHRSGQGERRSEPDGVGGRGPKGGGQ